MPGSLSKRYCSQSGMASSLFLEMACCMRCVILLFGSYAWWTLAVCCRGKLFHCEDTHCGFLVLLMCAALIKSSDMIV